MARLNEPVTTMSIESIESLKRRFLRQNRDLARVNSTQSVKIRSLENQIIQLVGENVTLRAHTNHLKIELEESRTREVLGNVDAVRKKLVEKLGEVQGLVDSLGGVGKRAPASRRRSSAVSPSKSPRQSPHQKVWRSERGITDVADMHHEGHMPTIVEGKYYPRRTLEPIEVASLAHDPSSDSPDIGPPPKTFLDESDTTPTEEPKEFDDKDLSGLLSANFETRRRRRETSVRRDSSLVSQLELSPGKDSSRHLDLLASQPLRAGAKRKLDLSDRPSDGRVEGLTMTESARSPDKASIEPTNISPRKALAPKPVNTDPVVSPRKPLVKDFTVQKLDKASHRRNTAEKLAQRPARPHLATIKIPPPIESAIEVVDVVLDAIKIEPKTPAAPPDLLSPESAQTSEPRAEGRGDTPPPASLASQNAGDGNGRGHRRARATVSYAEPSLISKMRRPTKEFVDAVTRDHRGSISSQVEEASSKLELGEVKDDANASGTAVLEPLNKERKTGIPPEDTRPEPQSPLGSPKSKSNFSTILVQRRASSKDNTQKSSCIPSPKSTRKATDVELTSTEKARRDLSIYDVQDSPAKSTAKDVTVRASANRPSSATSNYSTASSNGQLQSQLNKPQSNSTLNRARSRRQTLGTSSGASEEKGSHSAAKEVLSMSSGLSASSTLAGRSRQDRGLARRRSTLV